jgi:hypothetical protein
MTVEARARRQRDCGQSAGLLRAPCRLFFLIAACTLLYLVGCGSTKSRTATEQLLMSDAVDRAISQIDFHELRGQRVYFETKYIVNSKDPQFLATFKGLGFVNAEYIISSLRQQMVAADLRLQEKPEDADFIVEARLGAVGVDNNEIVYGIPASAPVSSSAASLIAGTPLPAIPEISLARKNVQVGAAKVGVFAYDRRTRRPVWQAGISQAMSEARDSWVLGVGPFQRGTIYNGTRFAGTKINMPGMSKLPPLDAETEPGEPPLPEMQQYTEDPLQLYSEDRTFNPPSALTAAELASPNVDTAVRPASAVTPAPDAEPKPLGAATTSSATPVPVSTVPSAGNPTSPAAAAPPPMK